MPKPVQPRYATPREAGIEQLDEKKAKYADNNLKSFLFTNLGLIVDDNGRVPKRNLVTPRMFVMGKNDKGKDFPLDVNDLPYKPGSREFTEQIMMGNVFVYPAGKEKPVQLQIRPGPPNVRPDLIFSDPLEPEQMPAPPVKPLTRRQKILRFLSLGFAYRREQRAWEQAQREHADVQTKLRDSLTVSPRELEAEVQACKDEEDRREKVKDLSLAQEENEVIGRGKDNFISVFKPVPEKREAMTRRSMPPPMKDKKGFYREEDFRDLTIFSNKEQEIRKEHRRQDDALEQKLLEDIRKANLPKNNAGEEKPIHIHPNDQANGKDYQFQPFDRDKVILGEKPLTDAQFAAAALAACFQPKHTFVNSTLNKAEYDPTVVPALVNCGLSQEEAVRLCSASGRSMGTLDLFIAEPRDNSGTRFKDYVNEGRKDAAEAFRQYQQGNKKPLAKLIAEGVNIFALDFNQCTQNRLPTQGRGTAVMAEELLGILEQEPELGELARQQGMKTENLNCMQGIVKTLNLEKQARNAEYEIAKARVDHTDLDKAKKKELARQIIMSRVACGKLVEHRKAMEEDKTSKGNQLKTKIKWIDIPRDPDGMPLPYEQWPMPKPGEVYNISMSAVHGGITCVYGPLPQYPGQLNSPEGMKNLEKLADTIVEQQNLGDKSVDELYRQLNRNELDLSGSILQAGQAQKGQKQEVKQEENQLLQPKADGPQQNGPAVEAPQEGEHRKTIVQI